MLSRLLPAGLVEAVKRRIGTAPPWHGGRLIRPDFAAGLVERGHGDLLRPPVLRNHDSLSGRTALLRWVNGLPLIWDSNLAAAHGMDLARPFHDRRVVELALAIPVGLQVRDGWNRHLARTALADLLPPEFATRDRGNDWIAPDFRSRHKTQAARLLAETDRLDAGHAAAGMVDFGYIRTLIATPETSPDAGQAMEWAMHGLAVARFVEWFRRPNR